MGGVVIVFIYGFLFIEVVKKEFYVMMFFKNFI